MKHVLFTTALIAFITGQTAFADVAVPPRSYYVNKTKRELNDPSKSLDEKLYIAVEYPELKYEVLRLIKKGANVNSTLHGQTPLLFAANKEIAEILINHGADVNARATDTLNIVEHMIVSYNSKLDTIQLLIDKGATIDFQKKDFKKGLEKFFTYTPVPYMFDWETKEILNTVAIIELLLQKGLDPNTVLIDGKSSLFECNDNVIIKLLIKHGADVNAQKNDGSTPLFYARDIQKARLLIENGANVNAKFGQNSFVSESLRGITPLFYHIMEKSSPEIIFLLIEKGADINAKNNKGETALFYAQNPEIIKTLIEKGLDINAQNNEGNTPLHTVIQKAGGLNQYVVKFLLESGANPNIQNNRGETPLHLAARDFLWIETVDLFIKKGADKSIKDNNGKTAADYVRNPNLKTLLSPQEN